MFSVWRTNCHAVYKFSAYTRKDNHRWLGEARYWRLSSNGPVRNFSRKYFHVRKMLIHWKWSHSQGNAELDRSFGEKGCSGTVCSVSSMSNPGREKRREKLRPFNLHHLLQAPVSVLATGNENREGPRMEPVKGFPPHRKDKCDPRPWEVSQASGHWPLWGVCSLVVYKQIVSWCVLKKKKKKYMKKRKKKSEIFMKQGNWFLFSCYPKFIGQISHWSCYQTTGHTAVWEHLAQHYTL